MYIPSSDTCTQYEDPYEALAVEVCRSFVKDYYKLLNKGLTTDAENLVKMFRNSIWLAYITDNPDAIVNYMIKEGEKYYAEEVDTE